MDDEDPALARNFEVANCCQCNVVLRVREGVILRDCFHIACDACLVRRIKDTIKHSVQVHCPAQIDGTGCSTLVQEREIRSLLSGEDYERYERKCLELAEGDNESSVHCFAPNCPGWVNVSGYVASFDCPVCSRPNCTSCKAIHPGRSCAEYQSKPRTTGADDLANLLKEFLNILTLPGTSELQKFLISKKSSTNSSTRKEGNADLKLLQEVSDAPLVRNTDPFQCTICFGDVGVGQGVILRDCFHCFCVECLVGTIKGAMDENVDITCPAMADDGKGCETTIQEREIRSLLTPEDTVKYEQRCLDVAESGTETSVHCLKPNCPGWVVLVGVLRAIKTFRCEICSSENCLSCKAIHTNKTCEDHLAEKQVIEAEKLSEDSIKQMLDKREAMLCPSCKRVITKNGGCDFIRCKCLFEICWPTRGPRWGPAGQGDESGGCRCRVRRRCHPKCTGCHSLY